VRYVAIKVLGAAFAADADRVRRFTIEAQATGLHLDLAKTAVIVGSSARDANEEDREKRAALAARSYYEAFGAAKESVSMPPSGDRPSCFALTKWWTAS
jgi:hypothetical protein